MKHLITYQCLHCKWSISLGNGRRIFIRQSRFTSLLVTRKMLTRWLWHRLCRLLRTQKPAPVTDNVPALYCAEDYKQKFRVATHFVLKTKSKLRPWLCVQNLVIALRLEHNFLGLRAGCSGEKFDLRGERGEYCIMMRLIWLNDFRVVKSGWVRWAGHVAHRRKIRTGEEFKLWAVHCSVFFMLPFLLHPYC